MCNLRSNQLVCMVCLLTASTHSKLPLHSAEAYSSVSGNTHKRPCSIPCSVWIGGKTRLHTQLHDHDLEHVCCMLAYNPHTYSTTLPFFTGIHNNTTISGQVILLNFMQCEKSREGLGCTPSQVICIFIRACSVCLLTASAHVV